MLYKLVFLLNLLACFFEQKGCFAAGHPLLETTGLIVTSSFKDHDICMYHLLMSQQTDRQTDFRSYNRLFCLDLVQGVMKRNENNVRVAHKISQNPFNKQLQKTQYLVRQPHRVS